MTLECPVFPVCPRVLGEGIPVSKVVLDWWRVFRVEDYGSKTPDPKVVYVKPHCVCKSGIVWCSKSTRPWLRLRGRTRTYIVRGPLPLSYTRKGHYENEGVKDQDRRNSERRSRREVRVLVFSVTFVLSCLSWSDVTQSTYLPLPVGWVLEVGGSSVHPIRHSRRTLLRVNVVFEVETTQ